MASLAFFTVKPLGRIPEDEALVRVPCPARLEDGRGGFDEERALAAGPPGLGGGAVFGTGGFVEHDNDAA